MPPGPSAATVAKHLAAIALFAAGTWATVELFLETSTGQWIDETALSEVSNQLTQYSSSSSGFLDDLPAIAAVFAGIGILIALFRRRFAPALVGLVVALGANLSAQLLKSVLDKPDLGIQDAALNSLPSGHTTFAAAAGAALFLAAPKRWRPVLSLVMMVFGLAAGIATVINAWHRPADVVAALFLVAAWTVLGMLVLQYLPSERQDATDSRHTGMLLIPLLMIFGLFMGFCALATYVVAAGQHYPGAVLVGSLCLIGAVGMLTTAIIVGLLRRHRPAAEERPYTKVWTY